MDKAELRTLLVRHKLDRVTDGIMALARPAIRIQTTAIDEAEIAIGASKMGGLPDLPKGVEWPRWHAQMAFIGQFNLADVHALDDEGLLPERGLLSFFYETEYEVTHEDRVQSRFLTHEQARQGWKVLYWDVDPSRLIRQSLPDNTDTGRLFQACAAEFTDAWTLPHTDSPSLDVLNFSAAERYQYVEVDSSVNSGNYGEQQLLGYGYYLDMTPFLEASNRDREWMNAEPEQRTEIEREINAHWVNLLQIQGSPDLQMEWIDGGVAHFSIEREALRQRDFSRVWLDLDFV